MAANSSSSSNDSILPPKVVSDLDCFFTRPGSFIFTTFFISSILLLLPLCILIMYLGLQRWRQQRSTSAAAAATSHSDSFTYHAVMMELIEVVGYIINCCGIYGGNVYIFFVGYILWLFTWYGETFFHVLTCVERYLAVVHPVTYLSLRGERGIRIRNISIGCVWLLCIGSTGVMNHKRMALLVLSMLVFSLIVISFCSLSVLRVLTLPGPGEQGGDRKRVHQSKRRAFYVILAILGAMVLKCFGNLLWLDLIGLTESDECLMTAFEFWFNFPSSLVLPLLFLHRAGVLACCKNLTK